MTALVKKVDWYDIVSDKYAFILYILNVDKLLLVDTCGLDHLSTMNDYYIKLFLSQVYFDIVKMNEDFNDAGIFYVKKLDSGKPDEVRRFLPLLDEVLGSAQIYFLLSGMDIRFKTDISNYTDDEYLFYEMCGFKIVRQIKDEVNKLFKNDKYKADIVADNIGLFCGDENVIKSNFLFDINNYKSIKKMFTSICMHEKDNIENIKYKKIEINDSTKSFFEFLLDKFFEYSSVSGNYPNWQTWNINKANISRLSRGVKNEETLGYWGTYNDYWYQLFNDGYINAVLELKNGNKNQEENFKKNVCMQSLINMRTRLLGSRDKLLKLDFKNKVGDNSYGIYFRKLLIEQYNDNYIDNRKDILKNIIDNKIQYVFSPFKKYDKFLLNSSYGGSKIVIKDKSIDSKSVFDNMFDFTIGIKNSCELKNKFVKLLIDTYNAQLEEDSKTRIKNIVRIDDDFYNSIINLENKVRQKYKNSDIDFNSLMIKYFNAMKDGNE